MNDVDLNIVTDEVSVRHGGLAEKVQAGWGAVSALGRFSVRSEIQS